MEKPGGNKSAFHQINFNESNRNVKFNKYLKESFEIKDERIEMKYR